MGDGGLHRSPHLLPSQHFVSFKVTCQPEPPFTQRCLLLPASRPTQFPHGVFLLLPAALLRCLSGCLSASDSITLSLFFFFQHPPSASLHPHLPVLLLRCWFILMYIYGTELKRLGMKTPERTTPCQGVSLFIHPLPPHFFSVTQTPLLYPRVELLSSKSSPLPSSIPVTLFSTFQPQTGSESDGVPVFFFFPPLLLSS